MNNNPLVKVIRDAFVENVIFRPAAATVPAAADPAATILRHKRIFLFERAPFCGISASFFLSGPLTNFSSIPARHRCRRCPKIWMKKIC